jgi:hypothetical protein
VGILGVERITLGQLALDSMRVLFDIVAEICVVHGEGCSTQ